MAVKGKHPHYYKNVAHLQDIDAYRVLERFGVTDPSIQHAVKKLLVAGGRGAGKDQDQDVQEAIDSLTRFQEMRAEDNREFTFQGVNIVVDGSFPDMGDPAFEKMLSKIPTPVFAADKRTKRQVKKMPEETKRQLATRKAAKRPARRGR